MVGFKIYLSLGRLPHMRETRGSTCQHQGLARRSAGKRHTAITNEVSDFTKIAGEILLERLIGRSIDVRKVEGWLHEQVDASTGGTSMCPIGPPSVSHRPCSSGESLS